MDVQRLFGLLVLFLLYESSFVYKAEAEGNRNDELLNLRTEKVKPRRQRRPVFDPSKIDLLFLLDKSSNVKPRTFARQLKFVKELSEHLPIFPAKMRVACVSVSSRSRVEFDFKKYINKECTIKGIENVRFTGGQFSLGRALISIREKLIFSSDSGARSNAQKIIVVFTNGKLNNFVRIASNRLKQDGVAIIVVGITKRVRIESLSSLASEQQYAFYMADGKTLYQLIELLGKETWRECRPGQFVLDKCQRECRCVNGKLVNCCRVRKQFTEMSKSERRRYIEVVKTVSTHPAYKDKYEKLLTIHKTIFNTGIHQAEFFLPWHRWFILQYENLLRELDCGITVPFWESMEEANNALASDLWNSDTHGFGGNGTGDSNCVLNGPFRAGEWFVIASAGGGCLTRNFNGRFPDCLTVRDAFLEFENVTEFNDFEYFLHREFHDAVHCVIGGHMCTDNSASSPEFFLHHGFVDKLWSDWQKQSREHTMNEHFTSQTSQMPSTGHLSRDLLDLRKQPGCACVEYRDPGDEIYTLVGKFSRTQVKDIPRVPLPPYPENARQLFKLTEADMQRLARIRKFLQPVRVLKEDELEGNDRVLGFRRKDVENEAAKGSATIAFRRFLDDEKVDDEAGVEDDA